METLICMLVCVHLCDRVALKKHCNELMMMKFGRLVDLEALQTLSGNRRVEELFRVPGLLMVETVRKWGKNG